MTMKTSSFLFLAIFTNVLFSFGLLADQRPNVVLIISDDHAWTDYQFLGHEHVRTPHIDKLAAEGLTFSRGYVSTALCSPSLATMLTGLYPHQHGITGNDPMRGEKREDWLDKFFSNPMLPQQLADAGYLTLHTGKYWMRKPKDAGFTQDNGETGRHGGKSLSIGRATMKPIYDFIDTAKAKEKPFFVWYAPFLPHTPHNPPARLLEKYKNLKNEKYLAMVEWLDETCGDLMQNLKDKGVDDNTLVLYIADNGWNAFGKASPYENGIRTPIIARWPAKIQPRLEKTQLASNIDIVPTILSACEVQVPCNLPGINLLDDQKVTARNTLYFENFSHDMISASEPEKSLWTRSIIQENWKLISWNPNRPKLRPNAGGHRSKNPGAQYELFDLKTDPHETQNLAEKKAELVSELQKKIDTWWSAGN